MRSLLLAEQPDRGRTNTWTVRATEDSMGMNDDWSLQAYVICANR